MPDQAEPPPPRNSLPHEANRPYAGDMEARVAVLEQIAKDTKDILVELKLDMREMRQEMREMRQESRAEFASIRQESRTEFASVRQDQRNDFRLLFGAIITVAIGLAGLMARSFHWF